MRPPLCASASSPPTFISQTRSRPWRWRRSARRETSLISGPARVSRAWRSRWRSRVRRCGLSRASGASATSSVARSQPPGSRTPGSICARAEDWPDGLDSDDVVTARALAPQPVVLEYAAPLLLRGGVLIDWRGRRDPDEESAADRAAEELGMKSGGGSPRGAVPGRARSPPAHVHEGGGHAGPFSPKGGRGSQAPARLPMTGLCPFCRTSRLARRRSALA